MEHELTHHIFNLLVVVESVGVLPGISLPLLELCHPLDVVMMWVPLSTSLCLNLHVCESINGTLHVRLQRAEALVAAA